MPRPYRRLHTAANTPLDFYLGDCTEVLSAGPGGSVSVVVTSPPHNLGIQYRTYDDGRPRGEYLE
jgi:site-specific DNA-methyltransferase (adenine-specific)